MREKIIGSTESMRILAIITLKYSPVDFQHEVLKKGIVIFKRDENRRIEYEATLISTYLDIKYMYEFLDKKFLARV